MKNRDEDFNALTREYLAQKEEIDGAREDIDQLIEVKEEQQAALMDLQQAHAALTEEAEEQYEEIVEREEAQQGAQRSLVELTELADEQLSERDAAFGEVLRLDAEKRAVEARFRALQATHAELSRAFDQQRVERDQAFADNAALKAALSAAQEMIVSLTESKTAKADEAAKADETPLAMKASKGNKAAKAIDKENGAMGNKENGDCNLERSRRSGRLVSRS